MHGTWAITDSACYLYNKDKVEQTKNTEYYKICTNIGRALFWKLVYMILLINDNISFCTKRKWHKTWNVLNFILSINICSYQTVTTRKKLGHGE